MATKTIINCMDHSTITQPNQGISIIIDQHIDDQKQLQQQQQVYETSTMQNAKIIKIQHSIEQPQYLTLNNRKNNKTLIDIKRNNDFDDDHQHHHQQQQQRNDHILQINCTSNTSNEFTSREIKEILENIENNTSKLAYNGSFIERRNFEGEQHINLAKDESLIKHSNAHEKRVTEKDVKEESGQTASQQINNITNNENANSKHRENGQNSTITTNQLKLNQLSKHNGEELKNNVAEDHKHHNEKQLVNNDHQTNDDLETPVHNEVNNREDDNDSNSTSSGISSISGGISLIQREVIGDFSHGKRSLYEENSNSLLTKADATTSTTLLTINANNVNANSQIVTTSNVLNNFENLTNDKKNINHVVKIQIKPNNSSDNINTLTEKQITVVKIENLQKPLILKEEEKAKEFENEINTSNEANENKVTSEIIENKENLKTENATSVIKQSQLNVLATTITATANMVQKPSNNSNNASVTLVGTHANNNGNVSQTSNNGAVTASTVTELNVSNPNNYLYYMMSSGQFSPCDTLDSGTGSDLESNGQQQQTSPNLQIKKSSNSSAASTTSTASNGSITPLELHLKTTKIRVANSTTNSLESQQRQCSFTDSEESEASSLSCDSLHSNEFLRQSSTSPQLKSPSGNGSQKMKTLLPDSLLREIKNLKFSNNEYEAENEEEDDILPTLKSENKSDSYDSLSNKDYIKSHEFIQSRKNLNNLPSNMSSSLKRASLPSKTFVLNTEDGTFIDTKMNSMPRTYEADKYYNFHVNEHDNFRSFGNNNAENGGEGDSLSISEYDSKSIHDDVFAGYKDLRCGSNTSTIRSSKGTVRGVKNRVRNGIATFLQLQQPNIKNYKEKDSGKVVLYTTSMGIIRDTYAKCSNVKQILRTLLVKFEERDVFMSVEYQQEIKERMHSDVIKVPQLYVEGQHIGDADTVERLNESGELRQLLKPYKSISTAYTCQTCGGYRLLPCPSCNGSKKSVHRNHFTAEFVALKCMNCDEVGLVKCHNC